MTRYKILVKKITTGHVRSKLIMINPDDLPRWQQRINVPEGGFVILDITPID